MGRRCWVSAQISLLINTQIASHVGVGAVSWLTYADRLMEFPTALLGVALGVVLLPALAATTPTRIRATAGAAGLGLRLAFPARAAAAAALWLLTVPLVATLYQCRHFTANDVMQTRERCWATASACSDWCWSDPRGSTPGR
jgi:putative peptidoglycan lipid II flippase